jgi:transcription factor IIIB subunit 2
LTVSPASKKIQSIATILRLSDVVCLAATRLYTLAVEHKFTKGRKSLNVVAVCLYVACRQKETRNYMLIDFSDLLQVRKERCMLMISGLADAGIIQVNVFELGHTYLQLLQALNLRLPLVDPSHYISRFGALLEFGEETHAVAHDAVRLVQRFDRDWMTKGRRPAGICGAALFLAARMNNFRRSVEETVQVVKIADTTLRKRLDEFKKTPSGNLTLADFRTVWLEDEMDPPAFTKAKEKAYGSQAQCHGNESGPSSGDKARSGRKKRKRKRDEDNRAHESEQAAGFLVLPQLPMDLAALNEAILAGTSIAPPLFLSDYDPTIHIDPSLLPWEPSRQYLGHLYPTTSVLRRQRRLMKLHR